MNTFLKYYIILIYSLNIVNIIYSIPNYTISFWIINLNHKTKYIYIYTNFIIFLDHFDYLLKL